MDNIGEEVWRRGGITSTGGAQDKTIMNRLMLRFRPIAPKPPALEPIHGGSPAIKEKMMVSSRRTKRKYVRVRRNSNKVKENSKVASEEIKNRSAVTLQLLPENRTEENLSSNGGSWTVTLTDKQDRQINYLMMSDIYNPSGALNLTAQRRNNNNAGETWVTVEYVSETTCMEGDDARGGGLGRTDIERLENLEGDTCPGFVSDGLNRVVWVNGAFRKMVRKEGEEMMMEVGLLTKERELMSYRALTCQAKVEFTWRKERYSQMVPCDAWRMDGGGFAWRLDVKAALSLGRYT